MIPGPRLKSAERLTVGIVLLFSALSFAAIRQDTPKLKIGEKLVDGSVTVKAGDLQTGAELFRCAEDGCVATRPGAFSFLSEGTVKSSEILTPAVRVTAEIAGRTKELAASLSFTEGTVAKLSAPVGAKIVVEPINFAGLSNVEVASLASDAKPLSLWGDYAVELKPVKVSLRASSSNPRFSIGDRENVTWSLEGSDLLPDGATVEVSPHKVDGKSTIAVRLPNERWQAKMTGLPLSGSIQAMPLTSETSLKLSLRLGGQEIDSPAPLVFQAIGRGSGPSLQMKANGVRVGDPCEGNLKFTDGSVRQERWPLPEKANTPPRFSFFGTDPFEDASQFVATSFIVTEVNGILLTLPLPQIKSVRFRDGLSAQVEPNRPVILPIVLKGADDRELDADPADVAALSVTCDKPNALSPIKVVTTGSHSLGLSFTPLKGDLSVTLTVRYHGREISTLLVETGTAVKSGRLSGNFLPLSDEDVKRLYGDEVANAYHVVECTLTNVINGDTGEGKNDVIVQPESLEFGAVVQSRLKKGAWRIASATATSGAILPGSSIGSSGFSSGSILEVEELTEFFKNAAKPNAPAVVALLAKHMPKELPEDRERWASSLNTAVVDLVSSTDWGAFATTYGYADPTLQTAEKERLVRRRLQIDTNEAVVGGEYAYVRWRPLSAEAVNDVFQVLAKRKRTPRTVQMANLLVSAGRVVGNFGLISDAGRGIVSGLGSATNLLPSIKQALPELSEARRKMLASMLFAGPLRLSPQVPTKKQIFISKEVMKYMFNAEETRISEIVQGSMTADIAVVTSSERTTIGSTGG